MTDQNELPALPDGQTYGEPYTCTDVRQVGSDPIPVAEWADWWHSFRTGGLQ